MKKILSAVLSAVMLLSLLPMYVFSASDETPTGTNAIIGTTVNAGTTEVTHLTEVPEGYVGIYTKADLDNMRNDIYGNYILMNDIEFTEEDFAEGGDFYNGGAGWKAIGDAKEGFGGVFDGNGFVVKNLQITIESNSVKASGFFGINEGNAIIKNFGLVDGVISVSVSSDSSYFFLEPIGSIAGSNYGKIINCHSAVSITSSTESVESNWIGGITGHNAEYGTIANCCNTGNVTARVSDNTKLGGIAGNNYGTIENCCNTGVVTAEIFDGTADELTSTCVGGIAGDLHEGKSITNCYNVGTVSAIAFEDLANPYYYTTEVGGIAGNGGLRPPITNCHNAGNVTASVPGDTDYTFAGGIAGYGGAISNCYNTGNISTTASNNAYAGGISGCCDTSIKNSYNTGIVMAEVLEELARAYAGGITSFNAFSVTNCYNLGQIKTGALGNAILGGIVGYNEEGEVTNCYYLDSIQSGVGYNSSDGSTVVSPVQCTLEEMKAQDTFTGFDFNTVWEIDSTADYPYPTLIENPYNSDEDKEDIVVLGYQIKNMADDDTMFAVRFSAEIYDTKAYDAVGFEIIELSTDKSFVDKINPCTTVYKSLCNYNGVDSEAPEKDGVWYVAVEIENIPRNLEGLEFEIKPYVIFAGTTERVYGEAKTAQLINY